MKYNLFLLLLLFTTRITVAQDHKIITDKLANFEYIEITTGAVNSDLPLLIAFHYSGGNPTETLADYDRLKSPVRLIIPKGNYPKRKGFSYYPTDYYQKDSLTQLTLAKRSVDSLAKFVEAIEKKYKTLAVVSGISQGGDISFLLAMYYPNLSKASFPFAAVIHPTINQTLTQKPIVKIPVYVYQGEADPIVSSRTTEKRIKEIGDKMRLKLFTYPGVGHEISEKMKQDYSVLIDNYLRK